MKPHRLLLMARSHERIGAALKEAAPDLDIQLFHDDGTVDQGEPTIAWFNNDVYAHYGTPVFQAFADRLAAADTLQWVHSGAAGTDGPIFGGLIARGIPLSTSHVQGVAIAEYVMAGVLDHFQRGPERRAAQGEGAWTRLPYREVRGTRWLIVGFGAIGQAVARLAGAFGAEVTAVRRDGAAHPLAQRVVDYGGLDQALGQADVVIVSLPLTAENRHLMNAARLARLTDGCVLVNVSRGGLVDEVALASALEAGKVGHAVLDVTEAEPPAPDSPLWTSPRVALSAHIAGMGSGTLARGDTLFLENIRLFLAGMPLPDTIYPASA